MNDNFMKRIAVEYRDQLLNFIGVVSSQAGFDRHPSGQAWDDGLQKSLDPLRKGQHARSAALVGHLGKRAAEIQIDTGVAHLE